MNNGGDVLARGGRSAQFSAGGSSVEDPIELRNVAPEEPQKLGEGIEVIDRRRNYLTTETVKEVSRPTPKYPEKSYSLFSPILDRILVKRCAGKDEKLMEDGSVLNTKTGLVVAAKYRQHSNTGVVLATGTMLVLGGNLISMGDVVRVGDRVTYGDYNSEVFPMDEEKVKELCDAVQMNYEEDPEGLRIVRVQDVRGIEREDTTDAGLKEFRHSYCATGNTCRPDTKVIARMDQENPDKELQESARVMLEKGGIFLKKVDISGASEVDHE
jgi:co-chaperonin GroES (HSP10)